MVVEVPNFDNALLAQSNKTMEDGKKLISKNLDIYLRTHEKARSVQNSLTVLLAKKAGSINEAVKSLRTQHQAEHREQDNSFYLDRQKVLLDSLLTRLQLALSMAGGEDKEIASFEELQKFLENEYQMFSAVNLPTLMEANGITSERMAESIPPDFLKLAEKLQKGEPLTPADWTILESEVQKLVRETPKNGVEAYKDLKKFNVLSLMRLLEPAERLELMNRVIDEAGSQKVLVTLVATNYLTVAQGQAILEEATKTQPGRSLEFAAAAAEISGENMQKIQADLHMLQKASAESLKKNFPQNYAGNLLNLKGIVAWFGIKNVALYTLILNVVNAGGQAWMAKDPKKLLDLGTNYAFWGSIAAFGATGDAFTGGLGQGYSTRKLVRATSGGAYHEQEVREERSTESQIIREMLGNNPLATEFYYRFADKFVAAASKNAKDGKKPSDFNLAELGITDIPEKFRSVPKEKLEKDVQQYAELLYRTESGMGLKTFDKQRAFINTNQVEQGLTKFTL